MSEITRWITELEWESESARAPISVGDILLTIVGTIGRSAIVNTTSKFTIQRSIALLKTITVFNSFIKYSLDSSVVQNQLLNNAKGTAQLGIYLNKLKDIFIALPPLTEQVNIVDAIECLADNISQIDDAYSELDEKISLAKSKLLDLAIRGKLLPQNKDDEPTSKLLERIRKEKESAQTTTKGKRKTADSYIFKGEDNLYYEQIGSEIKCIQDEIPFDIPNSWAWTRLGSVGTVFSGGTPSTRNNDYWNGNIPWITPADLTDYNDMYISSGRKNISELGLKESSACYIPAGSVIYSSRAPIGYIVISKNEITTNQGFKSIFPAIPEMNKYIYYVLKSLTPLIKKCASGTTFKEISASSFGNVLFPIPPIQEQKRIVEYISKANNQLDSMLSE